MDGPSDLETFFTFAGVYRTGCGQWSSWCVTTLGCALPLISAWLKLKPDRTNQTESLRHYRKMMPSKNRADGAESESGASDILDLTLVRKQAGPPCSGINALGSFQKPEGT